MQTLFRILAKPLPAEKLNEILGAELARLKSAGSVEEIILFGSAARGDMTEASDLDFVLIYTNEAELKQGREEYYKLTKGKTWPSDVIFVTRAIYDEKSEIGGVFFVCKREGRSLFRRC